MNHTSRLFLLLLPLVSFLACHSTDKPAEKKAHNVPNENFFLQRAYPDPYMDIKAYEKGLVEARLMATEKVGGFDAEWTVQGPGNIGARVNTVAVHPQNENIIFAGFSSGGLWRTVNGGQNWEPVFDEQVWPSIGVVTFDPSNPQTIYVGTGDPNISFYPMLGDGVYKSTDGGDTWTNIGLQAQRVISRIIVHPTNPDIIFATSMGLPFVRDNERGLYRTNNGGASWEKVLSISDQAGVIDLVMDPFNPDVLYASGWDRVRNNQESVVTGPGARIYKTTDGGDTWTHLTNDLPTGDLCRTGLAISQQTPGLVYAIYVGYNIDDALELVALMKSEDAGATWDSVGIVGLENALGGFGWYFGQIRVHPQNDDELFVLGVEGWRGYVDLGFWEPINPEWWLYEVHADKHDLVITASGNFYLATDGGLYKSTNNGGTWLDIENIPTTQFYRLAYNPHQPWNYYGGAQDNGTTGGNASNINYWPRIYGGDGFQAIFHPTDPNVFYMETQNGGLAVTTNSGAWFEEGDVGIDENDRRNWDMPIIMSNHNSQVLYTGTYRVYRNVNGSSPNWVPISEDLTDGLVFNARHHNITTISESTISEGLLFVGTADGNVQRNDGTDFSWTNVSNGLPDRYVTDVEASPTNEDWVYVTHSGYRDNEFIPRVHRSTNRGQSWEDISSDLPDIAVNNLLVLPGHNDSVLFVATDAGVYASLNSGQNWHRLGTNMPFVPTFDLEWNPSENTLMAGTFARSIMTYPIDSLLAEPPTATKQQPAMLAGVKITPNPASHRIAVSASISTITSVEMAIFDLKGRQLRKANLPKGGQVQQDFDVAALPAGEYFVRIKTGGRSAVERFIKQ